jgi:hypothetical protein
MQVSRLKSINQHPSQFTAPNNRLISLKITFVVDIVYINNLWYYQAGLHVTRMTNHFCKELNVSVISRTLGRVSVSIRKH